jgi:hypothetical protein
VRANEAWAGWRKDRIVRNLCASPDHDKGGEKGGNTHVMAGPNLVPVIGDTASTV